MNNMNNAGSIFNDEGANESTLLALDADVIEEQAVAVGTGNDTPSHEELDRLHELEVIIKQGKDAFVQVGLALTEIQDKRLYRQEFSTFKEYCRKKWGFSTQYGYRLIAAAKVIEEVSPIGDIAFPQSESAVRPLAKLRSKEDRVAACRRVALPGKKTAPTAKDIAAAVEAVKVSKPEVYGAVNDHADAYHESSSQRTNGEVSAEGEPVVPLPEGYGSRKYPCFVQMWEWSKTVKNGIDLEKADLKVVTAINSLVTALFNYSEWAPGNTGAA